MTDERIICDTCAADPLGCAHEDVEFNALVTREDRLLLMVLRVFANYDDGIIDDEDH